MHTFNFTGILELICNKEVIQHVFTSGSKINDTDILDDLPDEIMIADLESVQLHLTKSAWILLKKEGNKTKYLLTC